MEKYISKTESEKLEKPDPKKTIISDDAFAVCDLIEHLTKNIERLRLAYVSR
jgi:hypothetical protein